MQERCESAADACLSQAQAMRQSCSAHLLSIKMALFHAASVCVHVEVRHAADTLRFHVIADEDGRSR